MRTALTVNGRAVVAEIAGRTHLADFLRDQLLLTATHTGCEHGVCGACTVLLDGEPARACITYPALCDGASVQTLEGLADDAVMVRLREAFSDEHALQCGYCTPGMLVTARDIVHRLPDADDDRVRLELTGNLCRCTGYNGIVRAIRRVLDERLNLPPPHRPAVPDARFGAAVIDASGPAQPANTDGLHQRLRFDTPPAALWQALHDPALIAGCIPGAVLHSVEGNAVAGQMQVAIGPVTARFGGQATLAYDEAAHTGRVQGGGSDQASGTRLSAEAAFAVLADAAGSVLTIDVTYSLRGALSHLAKGRVVDLVAGEIAAAFGRALAARLRGEAAPAAAPLSAAGLLLRVARRWLAGLFRAGGR